MSIFFLVLMLSWTAFCFYNLQWSAVESQVWFFPMVILGLLALITKPPAQKSKEEEEYPARKYK